MPAAIDNLITLNTYIKGVVDRAEHHANDVAAVLLTVLGGIAWKAKPNSLAVRTHSGKMANIIWWISQATGRHYACAYNHNTGAVEIRDRGQAGAALHSFTNRTPALKIKQVFGTL